MNWNWNKFYSLSFIYLVLLINGSQAKNVQKRGVMDNLNDGLRVAGQMFGINTAADVANLVAKAFSNNNNNNNKNNRNKPDLFSIIQKGLQSSLSQQDEETNYSEKQQQHSHETDDSGQQQQQADESKQFQTKSTSTPAKESGGLGFSTANLITSMLRMVGFDASKLGALAINALIMIASAIGNTLMSATKSPAVVSSLDAARLINKNQNPPTPHSVSEEDEQHNAETGPEEQYAPSDHQPRLLTDNSPVDWFLKNPSNKMKRILKEATHINLADKLTNMIETYETEQGQGACLKMLVCKSSPFIWGMQKSLKKSIDTNLKAGAAPTTNDANKDLNVTSENDMFNVRSFFTHLPSINEYREHGEKCEQLFSNHCNTSDLYNKKR